MQAAPPQPAEDALRMFKILFAGGMYSQILPQYLARYRLCLVASGYSGPSFSHQPACARLTAVRASVFCAQGWLVRSAARQRRQWTG